MNTYLENCIKYTINNNCDNYEFNVNIKELDKKSLTSLVVFGGFSHRSTNETFKIMIEKSLTNYRNIITIYYPKQFKDQQTIVCQNPYTDFTKEIEMNAKFAVLMIELLRQLNLSNIHLIGKCAGAGLAIQTFVKNPMMFDKLILCVPSSPNDIQDLQKVSEKLNCKEFLFVWNMKDKYKFPWGYCNDEEEINKYKKTILNITNMNKITKIIITDKSCHEIPVTDIFEYKKPILMILEMILEMIMNVITFAVLIFIIISGMLAWIFLQK